MLKAILLEDILQKLEHQNKSRKSSNKNCLQLESYARTAKIIADNATAPEKMQKSIASGQYDTEFRMNLVIILFEALYLCIRSIFQII